jgi:hypothetical protein
MVAVALGEDLQRVARVAVPLAAVIAAVAVDLDQAPSSPGLPPGFLRAVRGAGLVLGDPGQQKHGQPGICSCRIPLHAGSIPGAPRINRCPRRSACPPETHQVFRPAVLHGRIGRQSGVERAPSAGHLR